MKSNVKNILKFFYNALPQTIKDKLNIISGLKSPLKLYESLNKYKTLVNNSDNPIEKKGDWDFWNKGFKKRIWSDPSSIDIARSFLSSDIKELKKTESFFDSQDITLVCVVKNDLHRMKMFYEHYREIGIKHFVIIDNNSDDGTREWLLNQSDSDIYIATDEFNSKRKYGWINRILSIYGFNRWYFYADSDELFVFQDVEKYSMQDLVKYAKHKNIKRIGALMLDMYSKQGLFNHESYKEIKEEYVYFDTKSYTVTENYKGMDIRGGPRKRILKHDKNWKGPLLTKHPLFYWEKGNIFESAHYIYPFDKNTYLLGVLLHYKFINTDLKRYKEIAKLENFSDGSKEYKQYIKSYEENNELTFMYEGSKKYKDSSSLESITLLDKINWP